MNPYQFLKEVAGIPTGTASTGLGGGDGIRHEIQYNIIADLRTAAGLVLDASTTSPKVAALETNALGVTAVASSNVLGSFVVDIPKDYDPSKDELSIRVTAQTGGTTDAPTLGCTAYSKRAGTALSAVINGVASAAVPNSTVKAAELTIDLSGHGLQPDDILTINLTSTAHTTDAINMYGLDLVYRSNFVLTDMAQR